MLSNLDKKSKFMVLGGVAIVVTTGIAVGIAVPTARASNRNINGVAGNSNGADAGSVDAVPVVLNCPCFDGEDLDKAMTDISSGGDFIFDTDKICTGNEDFDGMEYTEGKGLGFPMPLGYTVDLRYPDDLTCTELDAVHPISSDEATSCKSIMDAKCAEHSATLDALPTVSSLDTVPVVLNCPCFDGEDLDKAMTDISSGGGGFEFDTDKICAGNEDFDGMPYTEGKGLGFPMPLGYTFDLRSPDELTCTELDAIHIISSDEATSCKSIMDAKCAEYSATLNALPTSSSLVGLNTAACPCFTASELVTVLEDVTAGRIPLDESSCTVDGELKISYGSYPEYFAWGVGSFANKKTCIKDDMIHIITEDDWSACKGIVENSCALLP
jgi:hypothetical protein